MTTKNPFPGMNPFFEQRWRDAHTMLIGCLRDALQERLPEDLVAGAEEEAVAIGTSQPLRPTDADVVLDLQPLIDQCHERGRYHLLNYRLELHPPLVPEDEVWASQLLREHQLV